MRAHVLETEHVGEAQLGWALTHDVRSREGRRLFRKGQRIDRAMLERWGEVAPGTLHVLELEPGDLHEDEAGLRVARAVLGQGITIRGPVQSRYNLVSERKGLFRVHATLLEQVNRVAGVTVFTLLDRQPVLPGKIVAGVKVTPIVLPGERVETVERIVREAGRPVLQVLPFVPRRVAVVATEGLNAAMRERFRAVVERKLAWYGSELTEVRFVDAEPEAVAAAFRDFLAAGNDILMAAGGNTVDPLDPIFRALPLAGGEMVHYGAPAHPGSMFWLARIGETPVVNLASCSMYSRATVADLVLPLIMTGQQVASDDIVSFGYGGLLEREMAFRFPDYDAESSDEADETEG